MKFKPAAVAVLGAAALLLAACGGSDPLGTSSSAPASASAGGAPIVVGSADFGESKIIAELYAQAITAKGVPASTKLGIGAREIYIKALQDGSISVIPEYTGNLLVNFAPDTTATTAAEVEAALPAALPQGLEVLTTAQASDQDVYVVTEAYAQEHGLASLKDLPKIASTSTLGGQPELETRSYGLPGLEKIYNVKFKKFQPYKEAGLKVGDLKANKIQVGAFFSTDSSIAEGFVQLADPEAMILPQNVVPLVRSEVSGNSLAVQAIEAVQAQLTTADLLAMNKQFDVDHMEPAEIAAAWLKEKGIV